MNDNLDKFLSPLDNYHKKNIISNYYKNNNFKKFISYCIKLNITLFNDDNYNTPKTHSYLLKKIYDLKEIIVRSFGVKIIKNYNENSERIIKYINENTKKLEKKINCINLLINTLENLIDSETLCNLLSKCENKEITYNNNNSINNTPKYEIIDFTNDLFVKSDELSSSDEKIPKTISLIYNNNPFIAEYSN